MTKEDIKILLVDDEKQFVDTLSERLAMRGFEARVAYDGPEALKAVEQPTDVIVLDLRMPGMDGFEVLRNVKKSNPQVQVIILRATAATLKNRPPTAWARTTSSESPWTLTNCSTAFAWPTATSLRTPWWLFLWPKAATLAPHVML